MEKLSGDRVQKARHITSNQPLTASACGGGRNQGSRIVTALSGVLRSRYRRATDAIGRIVKARPGEKSKK